MVTKAKAGQKVEVTVQKNKDKEEHIIKESCKGIGGQWYCITHDKFFTNQAEKDAHISKGDHVLAWNCFQHGLEVP